MENLLHVRRNKNIIERMEADNIKFIRLQFVDLNGVPKSIAVPYVKGEMENFFTKIGRAHV